MEKTDPGYQFVMFSYKSYLNESITIEEVLIYRFEGALLNNWVEWLNLKNHSTKGNFEFEANLNLRKILWSMTFCFT